MVKRTNQIIFLFLFALLLSCPALAKIYGCIIPHHLIASPLIEEVLAKIASQDAYENVILLGPNHKNAGKYPVATTDEKWPLSGESSEPNLQYIAGISKLGFVGNDPTFIKQEHSIFPILPFIKKHFPTARITPLIFKAYVTSAEAAMLAQKLSLLSDEKTLVIASIDFSHHSTAKQAVLNDKKSVMAVSRFEMEEIYNLAVDSKPALYCLLEYLKNKEATQAVLLNNQNASAFIPDAVPNDLTSYVTFYFQKFPLTLESIFLNGGNQATVGKDETVEILATGDIMLGRSVGLKMQRRNDFTFPFKKIAGEIKLADLRIANLEGPIVSSPTLTSEGYNTTAPLEAAAGLKYGRIDIVNLANNHIYDSGLSGLADTKDTLLRNGINYCGNGHVYTKEIKGIKYSFLGFDCLNPSFDLKKAETEVKKAKLLSEVSIVSLHFGDEYSYYPTLKQKVVAHKLIEAGADLIIGNHSHYPQGIEIYKNKIISYSHGNFIFDQAWSAETQRGVIGKYSFYRNALVGVAFYPIEIKNLCQPQLIADSKTRNEILMRMYDSSLKIRP